MNKNDTVAIIRSLLSSSKSACSIFSLNADFKNETGLDIPLFGYANISDFLHSIPDTVKLTGIYPIEQVSIVTNEKSAHVVSLVKRQRDAGKKKKPPFEAKSSSRKSGADNRISQLEKYKTILKETVFENFEEESDCFNGTKSFPLKTNTDVAVFSNSANRFVSTKDCLGLEESVPHINVDLLAPVGAYVEIHPCLIFNPYKFYFHFRKFKKKFSGFMDKLQVFYRTHNIPKVTVEAVRPKLICAAFYKRCTKPMWHRAQIHQVITNSRVIVNFLDHGHTVEISIENLKYLHRDFVSLPRQAFLGSLANIKPPKGNSCWSSCAVKRFFDLSFGKDLVAGVVHIDPKDFCISVALSNTEYLEIHINDILVKEGFADFDPGIFNSHFVNAFKELNPRNGQKSENLSEKINNNIQLSEDILNPIESIIRKKFRTPVFYSSDNYSNNSRLKKMFS